MCFQCEWMPSLAHIVAANGLQDKARRLDEGHGVPDPLVPRPGGVLTEPGESREYPGRCGIGARRVDSEFKYRAFISYSHSDERWAKWLHKSLETYSVPKHLIGTETEFGPVPACLCGRA